VWWLLLAAVRGRKEGRQGRGRKGKHSGSSGKRRTDHDHSVDCLVVMKAPMVTVSCEEDEKGPSAGGTKSQKSKSGDRQKEYPKWSQYVVNPSGRRSRRSRINTDFSSSRARAVIVGSPYRSHRSKW